MKNILLSIALMGLCLSAMAQNWTSGRPDGHAPIGVMGDHTHGAGEIMISYRYMHLSMKDMRKGTNTLSSADVVGTMANPGEYMVTPTEMPMVMHMIGAMYAISDKFTLMAMTNFVSTEMDHITRSGGVFTTEMRGMADTWLTGLMVFLDRNNSKAHFNLGIRIPTGSITKKDVTPASAPNQTQLPYPMQPGRGTWDIKPRATFLIQSGDMSYGVQAYAVVPLSENDKGYKWGNTGVLTAWSAYRVSRMLSFSFRLRGQMDGKIQGSDPAYAMEAANNMVPTVIPQNFGGNTLFGGAGFNFYLPEGALKDFRLGVEYEVPFYQDLNGPQMETKGVLTTGMQYAF